MDSAVKRTSSDFQIQTDLTSCCFFDTGTGMRGRGCTRRLWPPHDRTSPGGRQYVLELVLPRVNAPDRLVSQHLPIAILLRTSVHIPIGADLHCMVRHPRMVPNPSTYPLDPTDDPKELFSFRCHDLNSPKSRMKSFDRCIGLQHRLLRPELNTGIYKD
jgi:hypothetical protein